MKNTQARGGATLSLLSPNLSEHCANSVSGTAPTTVASDAALRLEARRPPVRHPDEGRRRPRDQGLPQERAKEDALLIDDDQAVEKRTCETLLYS